MPDIEYTGVKFRELGHAQWAFVFDALGIDWIYGAPSPQWLPIPELTPTFYLPARATWFRSESADLEWDSPDSMVWEKFAAKLDEDAQESADDDDGQLDHANTDDDDEGAYERFLICLSGIPNPDTMEPSGPRDELGTGSMWMLDSHDSHDAAYQWTRCPTCGYIGAEFCGRAERLACGHGGDVGKDYRCGDPVILSAYRTARRSIRAKRTSGRCNLCGNTVAEGVLILAMRKAWVHAQCVATDTATKP